MKKQRLANSVSVAVRPTRVMDNKTGQYWESLEAVYESTAEALLTLVGTVKNLLDDDTIRLELSKNPDNIALTRGFQSDAENFASELASIHSQHAGYAGEIAEKDLRLNLKLFGEYVEIKNRMDVLLLPTFQGISVAIGNITATME